MCLLETIASSCRISLPYPHRHDVDGKERTGTDAPARGAGFHPAAPDRAGGEARASSAAPMQTAIRAGILLGPAPDWPNLEQPRSEKRRVGKECVMTGKFRWAPNH